MGEEADLDLEMAIPLIYPQKTILWQTDDEWYENEMQRSGTDYNGFFNSEHFPLSKLAAQSHTASSPLRRSRRQLLLLLGL